MSIDEMNATYSHQSDTHAQETSSNDCRIDGQKLKELLIAGMTWLKTNQQVVNALNVFPVPDGDTGTNMLLTMQAAYNEVANSGEGNIGRMAKAIAQGALMGARGNSGVILSQIWRGFARALDNFETMDADLFVAAMQEGQNTAYKGVVRPVEGTILTVAKDAAEAARKAREKTSDLKEILAAVVDAANESVKRTPELLPILKQAGVVDSGGKGLFFILEGMLRHLNGQSLETNLNIVQPLSTMQIEQTVEEIEPGQEVEVVIDFRPHQPLNLEQFYADLSEMGTSIQVGEGDGMYRMHIHVSQERQYDPIQYIAKIGVWSKIAMENLLAQMEERSSTAVEAPRLELASVLPGQVGVVAVSPGPGISRVFASLGVSAIVEGGQTMNPSTEQILNAFENLPTDKIIILPNNKNIILAAQNAASVTVKKVEVIPSRSVPQGLAAMFRYNPEAELSELVDEMKEAIGEVHTGEITTATRSVNLNGVDVQEGAVIGLLDGTLVVSSNTLEDACLQLLEKAQADEYDLITMFYGENISHSEANRIADLVREKYPQQELELKEGGQPHYQFIIGIE
ncbi:DAK2 domain-containing protein [Anaerolinea sp.]|uniref:DAK2 domain-containing protein n=1 Tax=Anaerolinea sp. TaxID=1872519 RepID=UPI002ACE88CE|nr:DAK2 domain-containing protein [Anaerolinea sp.]